MFVNPWAFYAGTLPPRDTSLAICPPPSLFEIANNNFIIGGVQANVVPDKYELTFDIRITPTTKIDEFEKMIRKFISHYDIIR